MNTIEVKTSELEGAALDWAVAQIDPMCDGLSWVFSEKYKTFVGIAQIDGDSTVCAFLSSKISVFGHGLRMALRRAQATHYRPSTDWSQGGPLIDRYSINIGRRDGVSLAQCMELQSHALSGQTTLIAACRAIVDAKLGDTVQVPADLIGGAA